MVPLRRILKDYREAAALSGVVAVWGFVEDAIFLTKAGAVGVAFRLHPPDAECLDHAQRRAVTQRFEQLLRQLDESVRLYHYLIKRPAGAIIAPHHPNPLVDAALQGRAAELTAREQGLFECDAFLVVFYEGWAGTLRGRRGLPLGTASPLAALSARRTVTLLKHQLDGAIGQLRRIEDALTTHLADILQPQRLSKEDTFHFFRRLLNYTPWKAEHASLKYDTHLDFFTADSAVECHRGYLQMDDVRIRVLTLKEPPARTYAHLLEDLLAVPSAFIACFEWQRLPAARVRRDIHARRRHFFNRRVALVNYVNPQARPEEMLVDDSATSVVHELGECLSAMDVQGHVFGSCSLSIVIHDREPERLERSVAACAKVCARHDGTLHDETYNLLNAWLACVPGNAAHNLRRLALLNTTAADLAPLFTVHAGARGSDHLAGQEYLAAFESRQHTPYFWNLHVADVGHALVLGATGSGKSFLLNFVLTHAQQYDPVTVMFDLGGSYQRLTRRLGGSVWRVGLTHRDFTINPFCLEPTVEHRHFLCSFVRLLMQAAGQCQLTLQDDRDLYEAIQDIYTLDPPQRRLLTLASLLPRPLAQHLARWICGGPYAELFDHAEDTLTFQRVQSFDFEGLEDFPAVLEPLFYYVLHRASEVVRTVGGGSPLKLFVMDEAWRFARDPFVRGYITEALKTWRKRNASVLLATQSSDDLAATDLLRVVVESCPTTFFLANPAIDATVAQSVFHLNETEIRAIRELAPRRQFLLKRPDTSKVLELRIGPSSHDLYTSALVGSADAPAREEGDRHVAGAQPPFAFLEAHS